MEIKNKLNVGDRGFYLESNKVMNERIEGIIVTIEDDGCGDVYTTIKYRVRPEHNPVIIKNENMFKTKEDLLASL